MNKNDLIFCILFTVLTFGIGISKTVPGKNPNILFILIDDMGYGDLGCYGNPDVHTPNIDQLAKEGIRFTQFYVNSPICSPSRAALVTGQYPSRWGITSYIDSRQKNATRGMRDFLDLQAPSTARDLQKVGYYTAHIGKWHLGGGRDIGDVPLITEYGFDETVSQFEGLGDRYLATYETMSHLKDSTRRLEKMSAKLGRGEIHWAKRENFTKIFVDHTIGAIQNARKAGKPFYIHLWPDDIHTPLEPITSLRGDLSTKARFLGVIQELDRQMGRLFDILRNDPELSGNTLVIFTSDNGPDKRVNKAGDLRGNKTQLYEGGIREPFIAWGPGVTPIPKQGTVNHSTVLSGIDLPLIFRSIAGVDIPKGIPYDGENLSSAITGRKNPVRKNPLFWLRPPDRPGYDGDNDPDLAIRKGDYKLLMDVDGSRIQLYNILKDPGEKMNLAQINPEKAKQLAWELSDWYENYPHDIDRSIYENSRK